jgi:hypothetical protein
VAKRGPLNWKPLPRKPGESLVDWSRRWLGHVLVHRPGSPFELLAERKHAVVRAETRRTRKPRVRQTVFCVGLPLLCSLVASALFLSLMGPGGTGPDSVFLTELGRLVGAFCGAWPLVMYLGAALASSGAVMEEIRQETALQLVLTPVPARPLAAAKILPRVRPYLWGILAALPLYAWAGAAEPLAIGGESEVVGPSPLLVWPLRMFVIFFEDWRLQNPVMGLLFSGPLMCAMDMTLVWTAALWGAVFAIRERGLLRMAARLAAHLVLTSVLVGLCMLGGMIAGILPVSCAAVMGSYDHSSDIPLVIGVVIGSILGLALFGFLWWKLVLCRPADEVLTSFQAFDRLANEEFNVGLPRWVESGRGGPGRWSAPPARLIPEDRGDRRRG